MNEVSPAIVLWLEQKRRTDRAWAAALSALALGSGIALFLLTTFVIYTVLFLVSGGFVYPHPWLWLVALALTAGIFAFGLKGRRYGVNLDFDPMGFWILKDICSVGPRLILEGLREVRICGELGELNVVACARALAYLAAQNAAVNWQDLIAHCPELPEKRLREQLLLLDGVLFLGEDATRVTLMDPFRLRLRWMLDQEHGAWRSAGPARPRPQPPPQPVPVSEPEKLSPYEILGVSPSATMVEIKMAYRKRIKECHPDLFAGMESPAKALAERWTKALNAAYATLNPRHQGAKPTSTRPRGASTGR
jgi:DnaJ-domain-containing protein 1